VPRATRPRPPRGACCRYTLVWLLSPAAAEGVVGRCAEVGLQTGCTLALQTRLQSAADSRQPNSALAELPLRVSGRLSAVPVAHHLVTQILSAPLAGGEAPQGIAEETRVLVNNAAVRQRYRH
jgi:hypothetical protein